MIVLFTGLPGSSKTTILSVFLKYILDESKHRVCTVDLDHRTAKLTKILTPNVKILCDFYFAEGQCSDVMHIVLSDRRVHIQCSSN